MRKVGLILALLLLVGMASASEILRIENENADSILINVSSIQNCAAGGNVLSIDSNNYMVCVSDSVGSGITPGDNFNATDGNISDEFIVSSLNNCDTIDTDANGKFSCGTDATGDNPAAYKNENGTIQILDQLSTNISNGDLITPANTTWASQYGNVTNNNQLANGAGYITTRSDTDNLDILNNTNFEAALLALSNKGNFTGWFEERIAELYNYANNFTNDYELQSYYKNENGTIQILDQLSINITNNDIVGKDYLNTTIGELNVSMKEYVDANVGGTFNGSVAWSNITDIPAGFADGVDDSGGGGTSFFYNNGVYIVVNESLTSGNADLNVSAVAIDGTPLGDIYVSGTNTSFVNNLIITSTFFNSFTTKGNFTLWLEERLAEAYSNENNFSIGYELQSYYKNENGTIQILDQLSSNISNGDLITPDNTTWASQYGNVTNNNQLANGAGYITTRSDTDNLGIFNWTQHEAAILAYYNKDNLTNDNPNLDTDNTDDIVNGTTYWSIGSSQIYYNGSGICIGTC